MISLRFDISRKDEYSQGDLGIQASDDGSKWLAEVLQVHNWGYYARLTRLELDEESGRYKVICGWGTFGSVSRDKMEKFRPDNFDFQSLANWQKYVDDGERERAGKSSIVDYAS